MTEKNASTLAAGQSAATLALCVALCACGGDDAMTDRDAGMRSGAMRGAPCGADTDCATPLACRGGVCDFAGNLAAGAPCDYTAQCMEGLYCGEARTCEAAGTGVDGDPCTGTADCQRLYVCVPNPDGSVCRLADGRDVGENCIRAEQCIAGLFCVRSSCSLTPGGGMTRDAGTPPGDAGRRGWDAGPPRGCVTSSECDDGSMCTIEQCIADICQYTLVDSDEDAHASTIIPGGCGDDCCDENASVNADHVSFEAARFDCPATLQASTFDWNCDATEEPQWPSSLPECNPDVGACADGSEGWVGGVPACGQRADYARCNRCTVEVIEASRQQRCR